MGDPTCIRTQIETHPGSLPAEMQAAAALLDRSGDYRSTPKSSG
jgi:hypothetical protein